MKHEFIVTWHVVLIDMFKKVSELSLIHIQMCIRDSLYSAGHNKNKCYRRSTLILKPHFRLSLKKRQLMLPIFAHLTYLRQVTLCRNYGISLRQLTTVIKSNFGIQNYLFILPCWSSCVLYGHTRAIQQRSTQLEFLDSAVRGRADSGLIHVLGSFF